MTLEEYVQKRRETERAIVELLEGFSNATSLVVSDIGVSPLDISAIGTEGQTFLYSVRLDVRL